MSEAKKFLDAAQKIHDTKRSCPSGVELHDVAEILLLIGKAVVSAIDNKNQG